MRAPRPRQWSTIASGVSSPVRATRSSKLGRQMSEAAIAATVVSRARASGQSLGRWLVSNETLTPALRAVAIAAKQASRADAEIAIEMPETWSTRAAAICACGSCAACRRLAAEPRRKKLKWWPAASWVTK